MEQPNHKTLIAEFSQIVFRHNLTHAATNDLAALLRKYGHPEVPKDSRTIMKSSRKRPGSRHFIHIGLLDGLKRRLKRGLRNPRDRKIRIQVLVKWCEGGSFCLIAICVITVQRGRTASMEQ